METGTYSDWVTAIANLGLAMAAIYASAVGSRSLSAWRTEAIGKRKAELAEQVIADFYEVRDIFREARQPFVFAGEGISREKSPSESESDTRMLNNYFVVSERLLKKSEFFAAMHSRRYRFVWE